MRAVDAAQHVHREHGRERLHSEAHVRRSIVAPLQVNDARPQSLLCQLRAVAFPAAGCGGRAWRKRRGARRTRHGTAHNGSVSSSAPEASVCTSRERGRGCSRDSAARRAGPGPRIGPCVWMPTQEPNSPCHATGSRRPARHRDASSITCEACVQHQPAPARATNVEDPQRRSTIAACGWPPVGVSSRVKPCTHGFY
jgi:hypothetical protein